MSLQKQFSKRYANDSTDKSIEEPEVVFLVSLECFICNHTLPKRWASTYLQNPDGLLLDISE